MWESPLMAPTSGWTNFADGTISKLRANDGTLLGTLAVGSKPYNLAFDGANVWLANHGDNK